MVTKLTIKFGNQGIKYQAEGNLEGKLQILLYRLAT